jgi:hypothetical protein
MSANTEKQRRRGRGRPWQPGQSGNPHGRPKVEGEIRELARTYGPEALAKLVTLMRSGETQRIQSEAAQALLDRGYGRAPQGLELEITAKLAPNTDPAPVTAASVLAAWRTAPRLPAPQPAPAAIARPATQSAPPQPIAAPAPQPAPERAPETTPRAPRKQRDDEPVIDVKDDGSGVWTAPPPHPEVGRVMATLCSSQDPAQQHAARRRAEMTVAARIRNEARLEREAGRPARSQELLDELAAMGIE